MAGAGATPPPMPNMPDPSSIPAGQCMAIYMQIVTGVRAG